MDVLRRSIIGTSLAVVAALGLSACGGGDDGGDSNTLRVTLVNHVWTENIKRALPEFEQQTGLKVEVTQLGEDQLSDQYNVKLNAGSSDIDVMMYRPLQEGKLFAKNGYLADLTEKAKGDAQFALDDFQAGPLQATTYEDKVVGIPIITEQEVLYYRKDLLEKAGYSAPPKTLDELKAAAAKIEAENPGIAGFVARTGKAAAVTQFSSFLFSYGGDFVDASGKAVINSEQAKQAYAFYGGLLREHGPENISTDMSWSEAMAIFTQGKAAFYTEANSLYKNATDPATVPGRAGRLEAVQHPVLGARHQRGVEEPGQRLEVHPVGGRQGAGAEAAEGGGAGCPDLGLGEPGGDLDVPEGPGGRHLDQHRQRCGARPAARGEGGRGPRDRRPADRGRDHRQGRRRLGGRRQRGLPEAAGRREVGPGGAGWPEPPAPRAAATGHVTHDVAPRGHAATARPAPAAARIDRPPAGGPGRPGRSRAVRRRRPPPGVSGPPPATPHRPAEPPLTAPVIRRSDGSQPHHPDARG